MTAVVTETVKRGFRGMGRRIWLSILTVVAIRIIDVVRRFHDNKPSSTLEGAVFTAARDVFGPLMLKIRMWLEGTQEPEKPAKKVFQRYDIDFPLDPYGTQGTA